MRERRLICADLGWAEVMKHQFLMLLAATCLLILAPVAFASGASSIRDRQVDAAIVRPDEETVSEAYVYLLGRLLMLNQERADIERGDRSYNRFIFEPLKAGSEAAGEIALHTAWIAVDDHIPVIIEIPKIDGRRFSVLIMDEWGSEIANINPQTFPLKPSGTFALVKAGSNVKVPNDATRIMLHSDKARLLGAIKVSGDPAQAEAIRRLMTIKTLFKPALAQKRAQRPTKAPILDNQTLIGATIFDNVELIIGDTLDVASNAAAMQEKARQVARYVMSSAGARQDVAATLLQVISGFQAYAKKSCGDKVALWFDGRCSCSNANWCRAAGNYSRFIERADTPLAR